MEDIQVENSFLLHLLSSPRKHNNAMEDIEVENSFLLHFVLTKKNILVVNYVTRN